MNLRDKTDNDTFLSNVCMYVCISDKIYILHMLANTEVPKRKPAYLECQVNDMKNQSTITCHQKEADTYSNHYSSTNSAHKTLNHHSVSE